MRRPTATRMAWSSWTVSLLLGLASVALLVMTRATPIPRGAAPRAMAAAWILVLLVILSTMGALIVARRPANLMADLRLFRRRSFAATGFVAFAISATVIGMISYLSLYVQNTLGYSPVQAGLRFLPLSLVSFAVALLTGRLIAVARQPGRHLAGMADGRRSHDRRSR